MTNSVKWQQAAGLPILAAWGLISVAAPAFAQGEEQPADETNEIVVMAPRSITADLPEDTEKRQQKAVISISMAARFDDLDLSKPGNADRLMVRIHSVARDACRYLDRMYPLDVDAECEAKAVANATPQAEKAIAEAAVRAGT
jgi:UrcA family protein